MKTGWARTGNKLGDGQIGAGAKNSREHDSLGKRFASRLGVSLLSRPMNFAIQLMVSRGLDPVKFGGYSYLSSFFTNI